MQPPRHDDTLPLLQARILSRLFSNKVHDLVLKGGMAMRVAHSHSRHTKDIDLDADPSWELSQLRRLVRRAIEEASGGGLLDEVVITEPKQTATTARWKINGIVPGTKLPLHLTVEISFRCPVKNSDVRRVVHRASPEDMPTLVPVYTDERLVLNKIRALLSDTRQAPRDVVDLFLLFQSGVSLTPEMLSPVIGSNPHQAMDCLWKKLDAMNEAQFNQEVLPVWSFPNDLPQWQDWLSMRLYVGQCLDDLILPGSSGESRKVGCAP